MNDGVSAVICTHNGAKRISEVLSHLKKQNLPANVPFEVLIIDNGSTDGTAELSLEKWDNHPGGTLRVVREGRLGLSYARVAGINAARHEYLIFVDDDNWLDSNYVATVVDVLSKNPTVAACGGKGVAVFETEPPPWFPAFAGNYAVGDQAEQSGDVTDSRRFLWGAGLAVRRSALLALRSSGFMPILSDREGSRLSSGGDSEICMALRVAGWRLWYEDRLVFKHFLPSGRLNWKYVKRLNFHFGRSTVGLDAYACSGDRNYVGVQAVAGVWRKRAWQCSREAIRHAKRNWKVLLRNPEGARPCTAWAGMLGRLIELLAARSVYEKRLVMIQNAGWSAIVQEAKDASKDQAAERSVMPLL